MPTRPCRVYGRGGKRVNKQSNLAAVCFGDSSSPAKPIFQDPQSLILCSYAALRSDREPSNLEQTEDLAREECRDDFMVPPTKFEHQESELVKALESIKLHPDHESNDENICNDSIPLPACPKRTSRIRPLELKSLSAQNSNHERRTKDIVPRNIAKSSSTSKKNTADQEAESKPKAHVTQRTILGNANGTQDSCESLKPKRVGRKQANDDHPLEDVCMSNLVRSRCNTSEEAGTFRAYAKPLLDLTGNSKDSRASIEGFKSWADSLADVLTITKIAEASYGEVYRLSTLSTLPGIDKTQESVVKLIALKPPITDKKPRGILAQRIANMSDVSSVASEIRLLQHMSSVPGFTNYRDAKVLQGELPRQFVDAWRRYNTEIKPSEFPNPVGRSGYKKDQLWVAIEMQDAGRDLECLLESGTSLSIREAWEIFWSVAITIAKGEEYSAFEHRDLHLGNICVQTRSNAGSTSPQNKFDSRKEDEKIPDEISTDGRRFDITIIDYTLSRATISGDSLERVVHLPLEAHLSIFRGDSSDQYQYEIYRYMRYAVMTGSVGKINTAIKKTLRSRQKDEDGSVKSDPWRAYKPCTNLIWLHFILHELSSHLSKQGYRISDESSRPNQPEERHWHAFHHPEAADHKTQHVRVAGLLHRLQRILDLSQMKDNTIGVNENGEYYTLNSAAELVAWAIEQGWLSEVEIL